MAAKSEKEKKETLNRFYDEFYFKELCFGHQEGHEIKLAVSEMVERIAYQIGYFDERVKIKETILVGSAAEGTKIILPNEFDFLLVLERFSQPGTMRLVQDCPNDEKHVQIIVEDNDLLAQHIDLLNEKRLVYGHEGSMFTKPIHGFRDVCLNAVKKTVRLVYFNENLNIIDNNKPIEKTLGTLTLYYYSCDQNGPAFNLKCRWRRICDNTDIDISIDLCFVMRFHKPLHEMIRPEDLECKTYYEFAKKCESVLVMPCKEQDSCYGGDCFRIIFTEAELFLCQELSGHHKKCYKILKYLINGIPGMAKPYGVVSKFLDIALNGIRGKFSIRANKSVSCLSVHCENSTAFHSYALKCIVYHHHYKIQCKETHCVASCIDQMLHDILDILNPGFFSWSIGKLPKLFTEHELEMSPLDQFLDERIIILMNQLENVSNAVYNYEMFKIESVNCICTQRIESAFLFVFFLLAFIVFSNLVDNKWFDATIFWQILVHSLKLCLMEILIFVVETLIYSVSPMGNPLKPIIRWWFRTKSYCWLLRTFVISIFVFYVEYLSHQYEEIVFFYRHTFTDALCMSCLFMCFRIIVLLDVRMRYYDIATPISFQMSGVTSITILFLILYLLNIYMYLSPLSEWPWFLPFVSI